MLCVYCVGYKVRTYTKVFVAARSGDDHLHRIQEQPDSAGRCGRLLEHLGSQVSVVAQHAHGPRLDPQAALFSGQGQPEAAHPLLGRCGHCGPQERECTVQQLYHLTCYRSDFTQDTREFKSVIV